MPKSVKVSGKMFIKTLVYTQIMVKPLWNFLKNMFATCLHITALQCTILYHSNKKLRIPQTLFFPFKFYGKVSKTIFLSLGYMFRLEHWLFYYRYSLSILSKMWESNPHPREQSAFISTKDFVCNCFAQINVGS